MMKNRLLLACLVLMAIACGRNRGPAKEITSEADLSGLRVAVGTGSCYDVDLSKRDDITLLRYNTEADIIQAVANGKADICVNDEVVYNADIRKTLGIKIAFRGEESFPSGFGFRKEDFALVSECDAMLAEMHSSGELDSLCRFWMNEDGIDAGQLAPHPNDGKGEPLTVACACSTAPISFMVGQEWYGLECDLMYRLGERLDRPVVFKYFDAVSYMFALTTGKADVLTGCLFITPEREETIAFATPYYYYHPAYFIKDPDAATAKTGFWAKAGESFKRNFIYEDRWKFITGGLWETLKITLLSILLGSALGAALCAASRSRRRFLREFARIYNFIITGIPMLVLLLIMFYVVLVKSGLSASATAIAAFSLYFSAVSCEVFKNSLDSVPHTQTEASLALGFTRVQTFFNVILPQAVNFGLPFYKRQCVDLLKGTSIVGYLAIQDLTRAGDIIRSRTFDALLPLLIVTVIYFILAWLIGLALSLAAGKKRSL